jgi:hypothetical protein
MTALADWLPPAFVGALFTIFGLLKVFGLAMGIRGGGGKPLRQRLCGSCPTWSRALNIGVPVVFLVIGLANLAWLAWVLYVGARS